MCELKTNKSLIALYEFYEIAESDLQENDITAQEFISRIIDTCREFLCCDDDQNDLVDAWVDKASLEFCHLFGHEYVYDSCGYWGHKYCSNCLNPLYPELSGLSCDEAYEATKYCGEHIYNTKIKNEKT